MSRRARRTRRVGSVRLAAGIRRAGRRVRRTAGGWGAAAAGAAVAAGRLAARRPQLAAILSVAVLSAALLGAVPRGPGFPVRPYDPAGVFTVDTDLRSASGLTAAEIDAYLASRTSLPALGAAFMAAERAYGVNARYLVAHAVHETGRGASVLAISYHNLFGWNAVDADPGAATRYPSDAVCIDEVAKSISSLYLTPGGRWWGGAPTLRAMNVRYASDPGWASKVAALANEIP